MKTTIKKLIITLTILSLTILFTIFINNIKNITLIIIILTTIITNNIIILKYKKYNIKKIITIYLTILTIFSSLSLLLTYQNYNYYHNNKIENYNKEYENNIEGLSNYIEDIIKKENFIKYKKNNYDCSNYTILLSYFLKNKNFKHQINHNKNHMYLTVSLNNNKKIILDAVLLSKQNYLKENIIKENKILLNYITNYYKQKENYKSYKQLLINNIYNNKINNEYTFINNKIFKNYNNKKINYILNLLFKKQIL